MSKLAIIDLGSNTCRLVIFDVSAEGAFRLSDQLSETLRIGENMFGSDMLQPDSIRRALQLLKLYAGLCTANRIEHVIATATSAVRDARNGADFVTRVQDETGLSLRILGGSAEAYYAYLGAINSFAVRDALVADLGGGSLELMRVRDRLPVAVTSLPLGAFRMSETFLRGDPIAKSAARALAAHIDAQLKTFAPRSAQSEPLIVLGGTARALARVDQRRRHYPIERLHAYELSGTAVAEIADDLLKKDLAARLKIKGLKDERADIIPAGALVIQRLMRHVGAAALLVSGRGLRDGLLYEYLQCGTWADIPHADDASFAIGQAGAGTPPPALIPDVRAFGVANLSFLYQLEWTHAQHVCRLALELFDGLRELHGLGGNERALLAYAAILHDSGVLIDYYRHHHHSAYLIENADLPGFSHREIALLGLLVRWHRRGEPTLEPFEGICRPGDAILVQKLVACLRMAEDLERSRSQVIAHVRCQTDRQEIRLFVQTPQTAEAELWAAGRETTLWQQAFGRRLRLLLDSQENAEPIAQGPSRTMTERAAWISGIVNGPANA